MKIQTLVIVLILILPLINSAKVDLYLNESYSKDGRNITLLDISKNKALVCVNNEKTILSEDKKRTINKVSLNLRDIYKDEIKVEIKVNCEECKCDDNCNNTKCLISFTNKEIQEEIEQEKEDSLVIIETTKLEKEIVSNKNSPPGKLILPILILTLISSGVYFLIKKR